MERHDLEPGRTGDEMVERLIRIADRGPKLPEGGAARIKTAIRPAWKREVARRSRRRLVRWTAPFAAAAAVAIVAMGLWRLTATPPPPVGTVAVVRGQLAAEGASAPLAAGSPVRRGDVLQTAVDDRAALRLANGTWVRIDERTKLKIRSAGVFILDAGRVYVESGPGASLEIRTPAGAVRDVGTRFEVRHRDGSTRVRVREGAVFVITTGEAVRVEHGSEVTLTEDGSLTTARFPPWAEEWDWIFGSGPPFQIEGRTVIELLEWVERESGLKIRFEDETTERIARTATLHGTLEALRPDEAAELILPSAGLEAIREDGLLRVRPIP